MMSVWFEKGNVVLGHPPNYKNRKLEVKCACASLCIWELSFFRSFDSISAKVDSVPLLHLPCRPLLCKWWQAAGEVPICYCHWRWHGWDCCCSGTSRCLISGIKVFVFPSWTYIHTFVLVNLFICINCTFICQVILLESRERLGGRIHTDYSFGFPVDLGASW